MVSVWAEEFGLCEQDGNPVDGRAADLAADASWVSWTICRQHDGGRAYGCRYKNDQVLNHGRNPQSRDTVASLQGRAKEP